MQFIIYQWLWLGVGVGASLRDCVGLRETAFESQWDWGREAEKTQRKRGCECVRKRNRNNFFFFFNNLGGHGGWTCAQFICFFFKKKIPCWGPMELDECSIDGLVLNFILFFLNISCGGRGHFWPTCGSATDHDQRSIHKTRGKIVTAIYWK